MRVRNCLVAVLVAALGVSVFAGDGDKTAPAAKPPAAQPAPSAPSAKSAAEPAAVPPALLRPAPKDLEEAMRRLARRRVTVKFAEMPFADAVDFVRRAAGFNVIVSPALQLKGIDGIRPLTMTLNDVSLRQLTELVAQFSGTRLKLEDGILEFTTPEDARGKPLLRIYSIADLTMSLRNFPGPDMNLRPSHAEFEDEPESDVPNAWSDPQKIVDLIQKMCSEDSWTDKDVSISVEGDKLIVKQYAEVHGQIARLIGMLRSAR